MNLQQLRFIHEVSRRGLSISEAAEALFTAQPGISKQIRQLEQELGFDIFVRHGKRLVGITDPGRVVLSIAERVLRDTRSLLQVGDEFAGETAGRLAIATTHTQARYVLPGVIRDFVRQFPQVRLSIRQGDPRQVCAMVLDGSADLAIVTEDVEPPDDMVMLPCSQWNHCIVAPPDHAILRKQPLTLEAVARHPVVTYDGAFTGRSRINKAFLGRGLKPNVVLTALDSDVIKTYVAMGLGVGILARMAYDARQDHNLGMLEAAHLFESSTTRIGLRKRTWLRGYVYTFVERFAPHLSRDMIEKALNSTRIDTYQL